MIELHGIYAQQISEYICFKRNLGYRFVLEYHFRDFDRFTIEQDCKSTGLTKEVCDLWEIKRPNETETNCYRRVNYIRNFSIYLNNVGIHSYIPRQKHQCNSLFVPYIFSKDEITRLFQSCDNFSLTGYSNTAAILPAAYRLIYGCGLRVSEATSLKYADVNLEDRYIIIRNAKNGADRILPISSSVNGAMQAYKQYRDCFHVHGDTFFIKRNGEPCKSDAVYRWFRKILFFAGISHGGKGKGPRVHDFRHSFSVHSLATMAENGLDIYYSLPILSKYLGHCSLGATDKYVRLTADMYPGVLGDMDKICAYVFPEVNNYEAK